MSPFDAGLGCQRHYPSCHTHADPASGQGLGAVVAGRALVRVRGASMEPTLRDGDLLLVRVGGQPAPGSLVVSRYPDVTGSPVKRVVRLRAGGLVGRARQPS